MRQVAFAEWLESQVMGECNWSQPVGDGSLIGHICLKTGECTCLRYQEVRPEDKKEDIDDIKQGNDTAPANPDSTGA